MTGAAALVLYDEDCGICLAFAAALARRGIGVAAIGSPSAAIWLRDLPPRQRSATFHAVDEHGRRRSGGEAVPLVLRALGHGMAASVAAAVPDVTDAGYRTLARSRRALSVALGMRACETAHR
jgi:predicted DCC family thiol-disulfide oxidoreductase YuxK